MNKFFILPASRTLIVTENMKFSSIINLISFHILQIRHYCLSSPFSFFFFPFVCRCTHRKFFFLPQFPGFFCRFSRKQVFYTDRLYFSWNCLLRVTRRRKNLKKRQQAKFKEQPPWYFGSYTRASIALTRNYVTELS